MSIRFDKQTKTLALETESTTYLMKIADGGWLWHLYYGGRLADRDLSGMYPEFDCGFSGNPYDFRCERVFSLDILSQEYPSFGVGDYRLHGAAVVNADGSRCADFRYVSHEIRPGKYALRGLPAVYDNGGEAETLVVTLRDPVTLLTLRLYYGVFPKLDIITRAAEFANDGKEPVALTKAASICLDLPFGEWELIHFHGRHCLERQPEREAIGHHITTIASHRGMSSHHHNPFLILCDKETTEEHGDCYGMMLMYSGGFKAEVERGQMEDVRVVMGIDDTDLSWTLSPGECFTAPEAILCHADGLAALSHKYHHAIRHNVCRGEYALAKRPVLINNWEATYFNIEEEHILTLAEEAAELGVELFVLDDGWFRGRKDDNAGLGDWVENREKLPNGLHALIEKITAQGLRFGLWIEPEMVNEDSELYRAHPDWALTVPGRAPNMGRNQLVLDLSRADVRNYLYLSISMLLRENNISYIKWDMNRSLSDVYSRALPPERQGETAHRCVLGVYELLERLTTDFPHVLFEGCAGGGGRFDAGMLYYTPQIWCSDDTDPIERLLIQGGTSYGYPVSAMGAHVSASPNHQTGRSTPIETRGVVAMSGAFGYELDLTKLSSEDKAEIKRQIKQFHADEELIHDGLYYRLTDVSKGFYTAWQFVSPDGSRSLVNFVLHSPQPNAWPIRIQLRGLDPDTNYLIAELGGVYTGSALMNNGYVFPRILGDYPAVQLHLTRQDGETL